MSIRGTLGLMTAEDVLDWAQRRRASIALTFTRDGLTRGLSVVEGAVVWASSTRPDEQLGHVLVNSKLASERAVADALEARIATGVPLGKMLQMSGAVSEAIIASVLSTKIRESVLDVLTWPNGTFDILTRAAPSAAGIGASVMIADALRAGRPLVTRMEVAQGALTDDALLMPGNRTQAAVSPGLETDTLWRLVNEGRTVGAIASAVSGQRSAVLLTLADWLARGIVLIDRRKNARTESARELVLAAESRLRVGERNKALELAARARAVDPSDPHVRTLFANVERAQLAEMARRVLQGGVPRRVGAPLASPDTLTAAVVRCIDGRWDALSIAHSGIGASADVLRVLGQLTEAGAIEWSGP